MHAVAGDEVVEVQAKLVVRVGRDVMEFIDGDQPVVEGLDAELVDREPERRVGADEDLIGAGEEGADGIDLAAVPRQARCTGSILA